MKKALITGASKSIGFKGCQTATPRGYHVYLASRKLGNGIEAVEKLKAEGLTEVESVQIDVSNSASVKAARADIGKKTEVLDGLINNADINGGMPQTALTADVGHYE